MQPDLSNSLRGSDTRTDRCSSSVRITSTHTAITFQPRAVRVGHEPAADDFDWALALTAESGTNIDERDSGHNKALCYVPGDAPDFILSSLSEILKIDQSNIGLKATTSEKIGIIGKNKAIAVQTSLNLITKK